MCNIPRLTNIGLGSCIAGAIIGAMYFTYKYCNQRDLKRYEKARFIAMGGVAGLLWPIALPLYAVITLNEKNV
jgi:hypothetical protein